MAMTDSDHRPEEVQPGSLDGSDEESQEMELKLMKLLQNGLTMLDLPESIREFVSMSDVPAVVENSHDGYQLLLSSDDEDDDASENASSC